MWRDTDGHRATRRFCARRRHHSMVHCIVTNGAADACRYRLPAPISNAPSKRMLRQHINRRIDTISFARYAAYASLSATS
ncbi:hypothetical protein Bcen2424_4170 [Burkholderia cenocepacia HI2424]|nr:hypothetical protein Bcen2424_4170 [Burkholderia cenocepacia HI2424]